MTALLYRYNIKRVQLIRFIFFEFLIMSVAVAMIYSISWDHIIEKRVDTCAYILESTKTTIDDYVSTAATASIEQIEEELDETVWVMNDGVNYRTGPDTKYASVGTLDENESLNRVGITYNEWSLVEVNDKQYYIKSSNLTTEAPFEFAAGMKGEYQQYAFSLLEDYGWDSSEIIPLINLWNRESGWNPSAHNGSSGAHGIPQALPAGRMASEGADYYTNGETQIRWGLGYIKSRYGSPSAAWGHFCACNWY